MGGLSALLKGAVKSLVKSPAVKKIFQKTIKQAVPAAKTVGKTVKGKAKFLSKTLGKTAKVKVPANKLPVKFKLQSNTVGGKQLALLSKGQTSKAKLLGGKIGKTVNAPTRSSAQGAVGLFPPKPSSTAGKQLALLSKGQGQRAKMLSSTIGKTVKETGKAGRDPLTRALKNAGIATGGIIGGSTAIGAISAVSKKKKKKNNKKK